MRAVCFLAGATGRVSLGNVDAATGSIPVPLQRLAPFDRVLVDAPCTSDAKLHRSPKFWVLPQAFVASNNRRSLEGFSCQDRHLVHQGASALAHWAAGAVKANAERQLEPCG